MKIPKPFQLASGKWKIQLRLDGKSIVVSDYDKKKCIAQAQAIKAGVIKVRESPEDMTLGVAIDKYIELREPVISPSTVRGYKKIRRNCFQDLMELKLNALTQEKIQRSVNRMAKEKAPKYVQTAHGLLSAVMKEYYPSFRLSTALPAKVKPNINFPTDEDIAKIMSLVKGTEIEIPILMALWMGMRLSEVRGATFDCIKKHRLHINKAIIDDEHFKPVEKVTKTYSSDRWVKIPVYIENLIDNLSYNEGYIVPLSGSAIRNRFYRLQQKEGMKHFTIHALRHANAAVMLKLGIPNKYAQERGGWATDGVLKTVYQYTMHDEMNKVDDSVDDYFDKKLH